MSRSVVNAAATAIINTNIKALAAFSDTVRVHGEEVEIRELAQRASRILEAGPGPFSEWAREVELVFDRMEKATREESYTLPGGNIGMGILLASRGFTREATDAWPLVQRAHRAIEQYCYNG